MCASLMYIAELMSPPARCSHSQSCFPAYMQMLPCTRTEIPCGSFSESAHAAVETAVLNMESCELKTATKAKQHHLLFAKSSISTCFIQKTLVFLIHTCCTDATEPTVAHDKHGCDNTIPVSICITSLLVSMQIKITPHAIRDTAGSLIADET